MNYKTKEYIIIEYQKLVHQAEVISNLKDGLTRMVSDLEAVRILDFKTNITFSTMYSPEVKSEILEKITHIHKTAIMIEAESEVKT